MKAILFVVCLGWYISTASAQHSVCVSASGPCVTVTSPVTLTGHIHQFITPLFQWQKYDGSAWVPIGTNDSVYTVTQPGTYRLKVTEYGPDCYGHDFYSSQVCLAACTVVPVSFVRFTAATTDRITTLRWETAGADSLVLQRSESGIFVDIASVPTSGSRQEPARTTQYRLKAVSVDGKMAYSEIIAVKKDISFDRPVAIQIITMSGARVFSGVRTFANEAMLTQFVSRTVPSSGVYCVQIQQDNCTRSSLFQK
jgi:hypothetical protein